MLENSMATTPIKNLCISSSLITVYVSGGGGSCKKSVNWFPWFF